MAEPATRARPSRLNLPSSTQLNGRFRYRKRPFIVRAAENSVAGPVRPLPEYLDSVVSAPVGSDPGPQPILHGLH